MSVISASSKRLGFFLATRHKRLACDFRSTPMPFVPWVRDVSAPHQQSGILYELQVDPPQIEVPSTPKTEPLNLLASPSRTVAELKARLRDMGWKLPANVVEKKELEALVEEAERQKAAKDAAKAQQPGTEDASPSASSSVAEMKRRLRQLGFRVPGSIVEKSELKTLLAEAEREAERKGPPSVPSAPRKSAAVVKLGSQLQQLGVELPEAVTNESDVRNYLKEAEQRQPMVKVGFATEVTLTCTRGAQGVAEIQVQGPMEEKPALEMKFDPTSLQRGDSIGHGSFGSVFKAMHHETGMVIAVKVQGPMEEKPALEMKFDPTSLQRGDSIGHGSFGSVFKAMHHETGMVIAVKEVYIDVKRQPDEKLKVQLENEIDLMSSLRHPHIVSYYGCHWSDENHLQMYLEYMAGGSLSQVLSNFGPLEESLMARYTQQLLSGLEYLHTQNPYILHRDIKGANVLVGVDSLVKLADFGCSKRAKETTAVTIEGSIPWMAPEVLTHSRFGRAGDIWSFGCLVIEMATADSPWGHFDNLMAAILKIGMSGELPPIPDTVSLKCKNFIRRCTQLDPGKRLSASELLNEDFMLVGNGEDVADVTQEAATEPGEELEDLPSGWEKHFDASQSAWYYWNNTSGRSQWQRPVESETDANSGSRVTTPTTPAVKEASQQLQQLQP
ncbi:unnamed protein product [Cladocopium goreaui]|uniref:Mitogen-activated protein kinase kinase kinase 3 (MAP3K alpha protein kinase) (AtMAP3Kalpha) n=1 Tax=Cladocopium goreaui TaxID=2562237 RepID=A0A9P1DSW6_9DINO|nr:unnamed protein product [Cladocopium goreaui]